MRKKLLLGLAASSIFLFYSGLSLARKGPSADIKKNQRQSRRPSSEKLYTISTFQFMFKDLMSREIQQPLLSVFISNRRYKLLDDINSCVSVKESDFRRLKLKVIFFDRDPVVVCGGSRSKKACYPAHYYFDTGEGVNNAPLPDQIQQILFQGGRKKVVVRRRNTYSYSSDCPRIRSR